MNYRMHIHPNNKLNITTIVFMNIRSTQTSEDGIQIGKGHVERDGLKIPYLAETEGVNFL